MKTGRQKPQNPEERNMRKGRLRVGNQASSSTLRKSLAHSCDYFLTFVRPYTARCAPCCPFYGFLLRTLTSASLFPFFSILYAASGPSFRISLSFSLFVCSSSRLLFFLACLNLQLPLYHFSLSFMLLRFLLFIFLCVI